MQVFRLQPYLRAMRAMGFDESGMAEIEQSICAAPDSQGDGAEAGCRAFIGQGLRAGEPGEGHAP